MVVIIQLLTQFLNSVRSRVLKKNMIRIQMSEVASNVSETDVRVFAELTNPSKTNMDRLRSEVNQAGRDRPRMEHILEEEGDDYAVEQVEEQLEEHVDEQVDEQVEEQVENEYLNRFTELRTEPSVISHFDDELDITTPSVVSIGQGQHSPQESTFYPKTTHFAPSIPKDEEMLEKQQVLLDMERLKLQGIQLSKHWTVDDRLDDMQFEVRRHLMHVDEQNNVSMLRDAMKLACTALEMGSVRFNMLDLDGWSNEVCGDMKRYDQPLGRLYRKYWKRGFSSSPEMELAFALVGSAGMFHFKKKMAKQMMGGMMGGTPFDLNSSKKNTPSRPRRYDDSSDEDAPP